MLNADDLIDPAVRLLVEAWLATLLEEEAAA